MTYRYSFDADADPGLVFAVDQGLTFQPRSELVQQVRLDSHERLCGAGQRCPGGS